MSVVDDLVALRHGIVALESRVSRLESEARRIAVECGESGDVPATAEVVRAALAAREERIGDLERALEQVENLAKDGHG